MVIMHVYESYAVRVGRDKPWYYFDQWRSHACVNHQRLPLERKVLTEFKYHSDIRQHHHCLLWIYVDE